MIWILVFDFIAIVNYCFIVCFVTAHVCLYIFYICYNFLLLLFNFVLSFVFFCVRFYFSFYVLMLCSVYDFIINK